MSETPHIDRRLELLSDASGERRVIRQLALPAGSHSTQLEAQADTLSKLTGKRIPSFAPVEGAVVSEGVLQISEAFVPGFTLSDHLPWIQKNINVAIALSIFRDVVAGLETLHQLKDKDGQSLGLIHGRLALDRILLSLRRSSPTSWDSKVKKGIPKKTSTRPFAWSNRFLSSEGVPRPAVAS